MTMLIGRPQGCGVQIARCDLCEQGPALLTGDGTYLCHRDFTWAYACLACHAVVEHATDLIWPGYNEGGLCVACFTN